MTTCRRPAWGRVQAWAFRCRSLSAQRGRHPRLLPLRHPRRHPRRRLRPRPRPRPRPRLRQRRGRISTAALTTNASTSTSGRGSTTRLAPKYAALEQCDRCKGHKQMCISISQDSEVSSRGFGCVALPGASLPDIRPENAAESRRPLPPASDGRRATAHTAGTAQSTSRFHKALQRAVNTLAHS